MASLYAEPIAAADPSYSCGHERIHSEVHEGREESPGLCSLWDIFVDEYAVCTTCSPSIISSRSACLGFFDWTFLSHLFLYSSYRVPP